MYLLSGVMHLHALEADVNLSDPTRPAKIAVSEVIQGESSDYKLSQIYISRKSRLAIINGQKVKMGDSIANAQVITIKPDSVYLLIEGSIKEISIMPSIKQYKKR